MRKRVAPLDPAASIPDPDRGGVLPPEGRDVDWTPHWALLAMRAEISVSEVVPEPAPPAEGEPAPESEPAPEAEAAPEAEPAAA